MIPLDLIKSTADALMEKVAIEIPQDYLDGLKAAARTEDGDLSSFVLKAMLDNYEAAKEDRCAPIACIRFGGRITTTMSASVPPRSNMGSSPRANGST